MQLAITKKHLPMLLALGLGTAAITAEAVVPTPAPSIEIEVWNGAETGWKARLSNAGSEEATWGGSGWNWNPIQAGTWFSIDQASGNWNMTDHWTWSGTGFEVDLDAAGNTDPYISYGMSARNSGSGLLTFQKVVTAPILPTVAGTSLVRASISGALTDSTGDGVALTAAPNRNQDGNNGNEVQLFLLNGSNDFTPAGGYVNAGVDVGGNASYTGAGTTTYGSFAEGYVTGPAGTWNWMQTRTRFTLSGNNDIAVITGYAEIVPIPEPETYAMLLAGLGLVSIVARRRRLKGS